jgi:hypothetical protein
MSSDVFIIAAARAPGAPAAIRRALELAGVAPARVQDAIFGLGASPVVDDLEAIARSAGLACPTVGVSSPLRALSFGAASILGDDAALAVVVGLDAPDCAAVLLSAPEPVGLLNLLPRARLAARSLAGTEAVLRLAGITAADLGLTRDGDSLSCLPDLLDELESQSAPWALLRSPELALLIERL